MFMNPKLPNLSTPQMIPVDSAEITISTSCVEQAGELTDLKTYFHVHNHLLTLLAKDDNAQIINWFDGRPKSMFLTICTRNQVTIQYAFSQGLLDEESAIESAIRDHLRSQDLEFNCNEQVLDELITPELSLGQAEDGRLFVDLGCCLPA
jgi:hypothetical protein